MHIVIKCKECDHMFSWPVEKPFIMERCPSCDTLLSSDTFLIDGMAEKVNNGASRLRHIAIEGIYAGNEAARIRHDYKDSLFLKDLDSLAALYQNAPTETQDYLLGIIDTMYLLIRADAENTNTDNLQQTYNLVRDLWEKKLSNRKSML